MGELLDRFARPPLGRHLQVRALELNRTALERLRADRDAADLVRTLEALAACWHAFKPMLRKGRWRAVKANLEQQVLLARMGGSDFPAAGPWALAPYARTRAERECLERFGGAPSGSDRVLPGRRRRALEALLREQSDWLGELAGSPLPAETIVLDAIAGIYRKARRALKDDPHRRRARRRLARLVEIEELVRRSPGRSSGGGRIDSSALARRRLRRDLEEEHWLRALSSRTSAGKDVPDEDRARLSRLLRRRRRELAAQHAEGMRLAFGRSAAEYRADLPWQVFTALLEAPEPLLTGSRPGHEE